MNCGMISRLMLVDVVPASVSTVQLYVPALAAVTLTAGFICYKYYYK